eukprot:2202581-Pyramimonas_sp.AAC.1
MSCATYRRKAAYRPVNPPLSHLRVVGASVDHTTMRHSPARRAVTVTVTVTVLTVRLSGRTCATFLNL